MSACLHTILCNGAKPPSGECPGRRILELESRTGVQEIRNVRLDLPNFIRDVYNLPDRFVDLLELAGYVFAADRLALRGSRDAVEYHGWAREFEFVIRVRDIGFWQKEEVGHALVKALCFMTGDRSYEFSFQEMPEPYSPNLFSSEEFTLSGRNAAIALFSGGLDSLAGTISLLEQTKKHVCLVSHQASPRIAGAQNTLAQALGSRYPSRISHYRFPCTFRSQTHRKEETQRSRSFLFTSIAFALAEAYGEDRIYLYENGITSLNLMRREDLSQARASRTTHPKSLRLLEQFFGLLFGHRVFIETPFSWKTKAEVFDLIAHLPNSDLVSSSVSCSKLFRVSGPSSHCGSCFQCIDRRLASFTLEDTALDGPGNYALDIVIDPPPLPEDKTTLIDYIRQAKEFAEVTPEGLMMSRLGELEDIVDYLSNCSGELEGVRKAADLLNRHGRQIQQAIKKVHADLYDPYTKPDAGSLLALTASLEYLVEPNERLARSIAGILRKAVPSMFRDIKPVDEPDLNQKIHGLLKSHFSDLRSEHPSASFACAGFVPDHTRTSTDVVVESKYIRQSTSPSKARDGMSADLTNCPAGTYILFAVYDPYHAIKDDDVFRSDFESKGNCSVCILR